MANKTKLRLNQISGSLGARAGGNGTQNAFTFAAGADNAIYINMDTRNTNLLSLGSANVGIALDGAISGTKIALGAGNLLTQAAGIADDDFLRIDGTTIEGRSAAEVLSDIGAQAALTFGISNNNVLRADANVANDDFLRVNGTQIEGRSAAETLSDIGAQAALTFGISNTNVLRADANVADDDFLRVNGTSIEGRTAAETLADIGVTFGIGNNNTLRADANVADDDFLRVAGTSIEGRTAAETLGDIGGQAALASIGSDVSINSRKLTSLATPTASTDAANKGYVDSLVAGLRWMQPVEVATTGELATNSAGVAYDDTGGINELKKASNGALSNQDNEPMVFNTTEADATRILVKDQAGIKGFVQFSIDTVPAVGENLTLEVNDTYYQINFSDSATDNTWGGGNGSNSGVRKTKNIKRNNGGESESSIATSIANAFNPEFNITGTATAEVVKLQQTDPSTTSVTYNVDGTAGFDNESNAAGVSSYNGIYWCYAQGDAGNPWKLRRSTDAVDMGELSSAAVFVTSGVANADQAFVQSVNLQASDSEDLVHQNWVQFTGGAALVGVDGVDKTGTEISLDMDTLTAANVDVAADSIAIIDANDGNNSRKESIVDLVAGMVAGNNGLSASSGVASVALRTNGGLGLDTNDIRLDFGNTANVNGQLAIGQGGTGAANASGARTALGLVLGISNGNVLEIDGAAGLAANDFIKLHGSNNTVIGRSPAETLSDIGVTFGISNGNVLRADANVANDDFLRVNGTSIEGRTAAETLSDIGAQAALTFGISNTNTLRANANLANDDFLRVDGTSIEGRTAAETASDLSLGAFVGLTLGIGNNNVLQCDANVADDDFLRVAGTKIEGRTVAELKADLGLTNAAAATQKQTIEQAVALAADTNLAIPTAGGFHTTFAGASSQNREIYLNGQLLLEGADGDGNKDWYESATANNVKFEFGIEIDDVIQFIVRA
jgi:uncharacterized protein YuzB (UPF0349 family)